MANRLPLTDEEGEVRELTEEDFKLFRPATEVLPLSLQQKLGMLDTQPAKDTVQLSHDVVERFRATGSGWQTRIDAALQDWLNTHTPG